MPSFPFTKILLALILPLFHLSSLKAYIISGKLPLISILTSLDFAILDLYEPTNETIFLQDADLWTLSSSVSSNKTEVTKAFNLTSQSLFNAPSRIILGGYNILGPASQ